MPELDLMHFLRPVWLLGLPLVWLLIALAGRRQQVSRQWRGQIASHLLPHLVVKPPRDWRPGPRAWLTSLLSIACLALAGPSWQREPAPFADDRGQLVIVLDLSASMNATDVAPTRLARARQKLGELLALRQNARTGLIVFADSAHVVLPPTDDSALVSRFLPTLESRLMPVGPTLPLSGVGAAIDKAHALLARDADNPGGTVLIVSDGRDLGGVPADADGILWLFGPASDSSNLSRKLSRVDATVGEDDVHAVHRRIEQQLTAAAEASASRRWQDGGIWLLGPLVLLAAFGFRRGWSIRW